MGKLFSEERFRFNFLLCLGGGIGRQIVVPEEEIPAPARKGEKAQFALEMGEIEAFWRCVLRCHK